MVNWKDFSGGGGWRVGSSSFVVADRARQARDYCFLYCHIPRSLKIQNLNLGFLCASRTSLVAQVVKRLPTMRETWVQSLGWEDPLEKKMATHSSTLAWKVLWTEEPGRLQSMGSQRVGHDWSDLTAAATSSRRLLRSCEWRTDIINCFILL